MTPRTSTSDPTRTAGAEPSLGELIRDLRDEATGILRDEVALAKTEMSEKAAVAGRNVGFIVGGALIGYSGLVILLLSLGWLISRGFVAAGLSQNLAVFLGLLIVAVVVIAVSAVLVMSGIKTLKEQSLKPEKTLSSLKRTAQWGEEKVQEVKGEKESPANPRT